MANRTFSFSKEDEAMIAKIQKKLAAITGKSTVIAVIRYALIQASK